MRIVAPAAALATLLLVAGCSDPKPCCEPLPHSDFAATVSGSVSATMKGVASFAQGATGFTLTLANGTADGTGITFVRAAGAPTAGSYVLGATQPKSTDVIAIYTGGSSGSFGATGGTLTIDSATSDEIKGTFTFPAKGGTSGTAVVTVQGNFDARRATTP